MIVEDINLTPAMIDNISWFQNNPGSMDLHLKTFDKAIGLIATYSEALEPQMAITTLKIISDLCYIKSMYQTLERKE